MRRLEAAGHHAGMPGPPPGGYGGCLWALWAKCGTAAAPQCHSLLGHSLDTAAVTLALWAHALPPACRSTVRTCWATATPGQTASWLAFLSGLHDLGKATPGFQAQSVTATRRLAALGMPFALASRTHHDLLGAAVIQDLLQNPATLPWPLAPPAARAVALALAGHHRSGPETPGPRLSRARDLGKGPWEDARRELGATLAALTGVRTPPPSLQRAEPELLVLLGTMTRLADWIASSSGVLPGADGPTEAGEYWAQARPRAVAAVTAFARAPWPPAERDVPALAGVLARLDALAREVITRGPSLTDGRRRGLCRVWGSHRRHRQPNRARWRLASGLARAEGALRR
jgi:CRISPR-associated endonuclease/helicase Cas3